jgi:surface protein
MTIFTKNSNGYLIAQYKFDKSIHENLIPIFNTGFINYDIIDESSNNYIIRSIYSANLPTTISFEGQTSLIEVYCINTTKLTSAYNMFYNCTNLTYVDLRNSNFSKVESIERMFAYCTNLITIDGLNDIDVSNVNNMGGVFTDCSNIQELNLDKWNVSKVTNFGAMFRRCPKLTVLDVSKWKTVSGVIMSGIFTNCTSLTEIDMSKWDMSNANSVSQMFYGCRALMKLKMAANLNQEADTTYWFGNCNSLIDVQLINFDIYTINKVIEGLPTKTASNQGSLVVYKLDESINTSTADSKYWIVSLAPNIKQLYLNNVLVENLYIGEVEIAAMYLGDILVYENKQASNNRDTLYNEFTSTLFVLKEHALSYDEEEPALNINNDIVVVNYDEENLNIGGDK